MGEGDLAASSLVRLRPNDPPAATLALVAGVVLHEVVKDALELAMPGEWDTRLCIKWPNDLIADGAKLAGILLERQSEAIILGFGVNLATHPAEPGRPATSVATLAGHAPDAARIIAALADTFARRLDQWRGEGLAPIRRAWLAAAHPIGTPLSVEAGESERVEGRFDGLGDDGALRLSLADGTERVVRAGDVFLV